jgi:hypothetical protein
MPAYGLNPHSLPSYALSSHNSIEPVWTKTKDLNVGAPATLCLENLAVYGVSHTGHTVSLLVENVGLIARAVRRGI